MVKVIYETDLISSTLIMHAVNQKKKKKYIDSYVHAVNKKNKKSINQSPQFLISSGWNVWVSGCHRSTKEVTRLQSISICGRWVTRYSLH